MFPGSSDDIVGDDFEGVESDGLAEGSALAGNEDIAFLDAETGGKMHRDIFMSLLESFIFLHVVQVVSSDDHSSVHFCRNNHSSICLFIGSYWEIEGFRLMYFTILPLIDTFPVNGHFLSI